MVDEDVGVLDGAEFGFESERESASGFEPGAGLVELVSLVAFFVAWFLDGFWLSNASLSSDMPSPDAS